MKKLILVRHSYAEAGGFYDSDFTRVLTSNGNLVAENQAAILLGKEIFPELIITSNAKRALQTTNIFNRALKPENGIIEAPFLYDQFTTIDFFQMLNELSENLNTVMIIGHNPTISAMASRIDAKLSYSFKPCAMAILNCGKSWQQLEVGAGNLLEYFNT